MRKRAAALFCILLMGILTGCGGDYDWAKNAETGLEAVDLDSAEELYHIRVTAGDTILTGVLYDTETSRAFAAMLPLTAELWHPAPGFARAIDLPERIPRYEYELGSLAYWYDGPSVALIYQASRGYQSFVVNYRLRPYTQEEGTLDLACAVRFVRKNADVYGIGGNNIAVIGFSAGGILAGEMLLHYGGLVNGTVLDADYVPDALDEISADAAADGMIYSFTDA